MIGLRRHVMLSASVAVDVLASILSPAGEDYAYYDFTAMDRLYQQPAGTDAADAVGNVIGLAIGRSKQGKKAFAEVMAAQPELLLDGAFNSPLAVTWPTSSASAVINNGRLEVTRAGGANVAAVSPPIQVTAGKLYRVSAGVIAALTGTPLMSFTVRTSSGPTGGTNRGGVVTSVVAPKTFYFIAAATEAIYLHAGVVTSDGTIAYDDLSVKEVPAHHASQDGSSFKPVLQVGGAKFDGSDDNLLTDWQAAGQENCILGSVLVPVSLSATQIIAGSQGNNQAGRLWIGVTVAGALRFGLGDGGFADTDGVDVRGKSIDFCVTTDGQTARIMIDGVLVATFAHPAGVYAGFPYRIGSNSPQGIASSYFGGVIQRLIFGRKNVSLNQYQQIRPILTAA